MDYEYIFTNTNASDINHLMSGHYKDWEVVSHSLIVDPIPSYSKTYSLLLRRKK